MRTWRLTLLAAVAALGLQACDQSPPQTSVQPPQASLPDDAVLNGTNGSQAPQVAATPPADGTQSPQVAARPPADGTTGPQPAATPETTAEAPPPSTSVMGAQPDANPQPAGAAAAPSQAPGGEGSAAMTEMWQAFPPAAGGSTPAPTSAAPAGDAPAKVSSADLPAVRNRGDAQGAQLLAQRRLEVPVVGVMPTALSDHYEQSRGRRTHEAIDILARAGTPVVAVDDGRIAKLFTSKPGGLTVYQFDPQSRLAYYYAHLQGYAQGLREGMDVHRGDLIGYVGSTGNADAKTPHLHFAVFRLGSPAKWWQGEAVNPYPALSRAQPVQQVAQR
ncbi:peptidoglycan DD-metalloendopeptidase family protein [Ramlibacter alkalitolerans]|nr:peptidoglycan DD-metalloendopeptidase family protein [Ramlibacter alkalitolerans]